MVQGDVTVYGADIPVEVFVDVAKSVYIEQGEVVWTALGDRLYELFPVLRDNIDGTPTGGRTFLRKHVNSAWYMIKGWGNHPENYFEGLGVQTKKRVTTSRRKR